MNIYPWLAASLDEGNVGILNWLGVGLAVPFHKNLPATETTPRVSNYTYWGGGWEGETERRGSGLEEAERRGRRRGGGVEGQEEWPRGGGGGGGGGGGKDHRRGRRRGRVGLRRRWRRRGRRKRRKWWWMGRRRKRCFQRALNEKRLIFLNYVKCGSEKATRWEKHSFQTPPPHRHAQTSCTGWGTCSRKHCLTPGRRIWQTDCLIQRYITNIHPYIYFQTPVLTKRK